MLEHDAEARVPEIGIIDALTQESAPGITISSLRRTSKRTRTSPVEGEKVKKSRKGSSSEVIPETTTNHDEGTSVAKDDDSKEQFSRMRPHTV